VIMPAKRGTRTDKKRAAKRTKASKPESPKYLGNPATMELHLADFESGSCNVAEIKNPQAFDDFETAIAAGYEGCGHCCKRLGEGKHTVTVEDPDPER
jgi:hypothetical protein